MKYKKISSMVTLGFLTASLITTSFGGVLANSALAAAPEVNSIEEKSDDSKGLMIGIAALGLIGLLSNHSGDKEMTESTKGSATTPADNNSAPKPSPPPVSDTSPVSTNTSADEKRAFDLLNIDRANNGLKALKFNTKLTALGEKYAQDMINRKFFSHYNPEGQSPFDRMNEAGIKYSYAGENLAINTNVATAEKAFMNSSGHRANILNPNYTEVGIGVRYDTKGSVYVVQEFIGKK